MKEAIVLAVLVVVGFLVYGGVEAAKPGNEELKPTLFTLLDGVEIPATTTISNLPYVDIEGFSDFRLFVRREGGTQTTGQIIVSVKQSWDGLTDVLNWGAAASINTQQAFPFDFVFPIPDHPAGNPPGLDSPYLFLRPIVENTSAEAQIISVFLYAVP